MHRKQAGPVRQTVEVIVSGAAGMAMVGGLLALLHVGGTPPAIAAENPPTLTQHSPNGTPTLIAISSAPPGAITGNGGDGSGSGGVSGGGSGGGGLEPMGAGAAAQTNAAVPLNPPSSPAASVPSTPPSPSASPHPSASPSHSATPTPSPSASSAGLLGGAVSGVVGGLSGVVGGLVGGLSGGKH